MLILLFILSYFLRNFPNTLAGGQLLHIESLKPEEEESKNWKKFILKWE